MIMSNLKKNVASQLYNKYSPKAYYSQSDIIVDGYIPVIRLYIRCIVASGRVEIVDLFHEIISSSIHAFTFAPVIENYTLLDLMRYVAVFIIFARTKGGEFNGKE